MNPSSNSNASPIAIGFTTLTALVIANMVGAGVFTSSGFAISNLGTPGRVMLAWWLCGLWALCGALAYGSLVRRLPFSGGEYLFLTRLIHPSVGFLAGWISLVAGFTVPIAIAALTAILYAFPDIAEGSLTQRWIASGLIVAVSAAHLIGLRIGAGAQNIIVGVKFLLLAIFITWVFAGTSAEQWLGLTETTQAQAEQDNQAISLNSTVPSGWAEWSALLGAMSWIALSYTGFNAAVYVAGESKQAQKLVPFAMFVATIVVTVLYLLLNYIFVYAPAKEAILLEPKVAMIATSVFGLSRLEGLLRGVIVLSMVSSVFAMLLAGPRVYAKMAEDGVMPKLLAQTGDAPPRWATVVQTVFCLVAVFWGRLLDLMSYLGLTLSACGALALVSLLWMHRKLPDAKPLAWWETTALVVHLVITLGILAASARERPTQFVAMVITFVSGAIVYFLFVSYGRQTHRVE